MPGRSSRWFMSSASAEQEDPYTRNDSPRSRPFPQQQQPGQKQRFRRPLSMASTIFTIKPSKARPSFPAVFNIIRFSIYAAVLVWTIICMAIAVHFNALLMSSDLTTFIPLAIFVSVATLLIFVALIGFTLWKRDASPISARIELGCLGLAGVLWIALGALMASSDADMAEVECYASDDDTEPIELPGFSTETFQAQYRVLEAFALFNAILIWGFLIFLLLLVLRRRRQGNEYVWLQPVTDLPWTDYKGNASAQQDKLPAPVTSRRGRSQSRPARPAMVEKNDSYGSSSKETPASTPGTTPRGLEQGILWMPHIAHNSASNNAAAAASYAQRPGQPNRTPTYPARTVPATALYDKYHRSASPRRTDSQRSTDQPRRPSREPQRNDSQRTAVSVGASKAMAGKEPKRNDSQRTAVSTSRPLGGGKEPQRNDSQRTAVSASRYPREREPQRNDSQRSHGSARPVDPRRNDSQRSYRTLERVGRDPEPRRMDSARSTERTRTDRWGRGASPRR